jgi:hypothetical protein
MLKYYDFSGVSFLVDKRFECENASENAAARFDLVHNPTVPYLTDSKFTPFSAPSRGRLSFRVGFGQQNKQTQTEPGRILHTHNFKYLVVLKCAPFVPQFESYN